MLAEGCGEERGEAVAPSCGDGGLVSSRLSVVCPVTILRFLVVEAVVMPLQACREARVSSKTRRWEVLLG